MFSIAFHVSAVIHSFFFGKGGRRGNLCPFTQYFTHMTHFARFVVRSQKMQPESRASRTYKGIGLLEFVVVQKSNSTASK